MRLTRTCRFWISPWRSYSSSASLPRSPIVRIKNATFYRQQPSPDSSDEIRNPPLFPGLTFDLSTDQHSKEHWAIVGPSNSGKSTFLQILRGQYLCFPPTARSYPYLNSDELRQRDSSLSWPNKAIQYVGFNTQQHGASNVGTYLSARYESRREATDFSLLDFLRGKTQLNALEENGIEHDFSLMTDVIRDLRLGDLVDMPLNNLSNGQTRRARIAKALLGKPELLLLDEPFMGLDPPTITQFNPLLRKLAYASSPRLFLALRSQDPIPDWITHVLFLGEDMKTTHSGSPSEVLEALQAENLSLGKPQNLTSVPRFNLEFGRILTDDGVFTHPSRLDDSKRQRHLFYKAKWDKGDRSEQVRQAMGLNELISYRRRIDFSKSEVADEVPDGEPLIEMSGVTVGYGGVPILGNWDKRYEMPYQENPQKKTAMCPLPTLLHFPQVDTPSASAPGLHWTVRRGQRWCVIGPNGSGKTTLLSLITSDHPQAYALPIKLFGRSRLPQRGQSPISLFDLQSRIGHSSPEVHAFFPKHLTVRAVLESAYADTPLSRPRLTVAADARISACLRWFQGELHPQLGMHPLLKDEMLNTSPWERKDYAHPGGAEIYLRNQAEYWYKLTTAQEASVEWADDLPFADLTFSAQRVALFLRAIVAQPDIVLLDEAFSGMDEDVRDKCLLFLDAGETRRLTPYRQQRRHLGYVSPVGFGVDDRSFREMQFTGITFEGPLMDAHQALVCISHVRQEVPRCVTRWMYLPENGGPGMGYEESARPEEPTGVFTTGGLRGQLMASDAHLWSQIWDIPRLERRDATAEDVERIEREKSEIEAKKQEIRDGWQPKQGRRKRDGVTHVRQAKLPKAGGRRKDRSPESGYVRQMDGSKVTGNDGED